ncbi:putative transcriptional regulator, TetR family protein [Actinoplanes cyaneus]|uniref:Transcriptional regulator, TetR family protein n=1 Tax=Actinoplanes cyaneus TaxID=52696 RepID=A0A919ME69_9ACTN|nr:TetR/AcrR family transcriptional regulator [Actinoplanes cyaneus]MCW2139815.1 transcriptional regulator, TetR family [Actinoplanes cyaneus]GID67896.1 putative transcriptional regulator, TetR family protein [Actinoplanes cyaneus]
MPRGDQRSEPRRRPVQVRAELTRVRILAAAAHVFSEYGYAAGTTNRIAEQARVSIGSLYQYFPNKDAILAELLLQHIDDSRPFLNTAGLTLEEAIRRFVHQTVSQHRLDPRLLRMMIEEAPLSPDLVDKISRYDRKRAAELRELLQTHPEARVDDPDTAIRLVVTTVELVTHTLTAAPEPVDPQRLENELVTMLTRYLTGPDSVP